jgi:multiple sugar transport system permease protein
MTWIWQHVGRHCEWRRWRDIWQTFLLRLVGRDWFSNGFRALVLTVVVLLCAVPPIVVLSQFIPWRVLNQFPGLVESAMEHESATIGRTVAYALITATAQCVLGTAAAVAVYDLRRRWVRHLFAGLFIVPYAAPSFAGILGWKFLLGDGTPAAHCLAHVAGIEGTNILGHENTAFLILCVISIWQFFPFVFFFIYCALLAVPEETLRCASAEGLNRVQRFGTILLPRLLPVLAGLFLIRVLFMFSKYDTAALLGGTGLVQALRTLPIELFDLIAASPGGPSPAVQAFLVTMCVATAIFALVYALLMGAIRIRGISPVVLAWRGLTTIYAATVGIVLVFGAVFALTPLALLVLGSFIRSANLDRGIIWTADLFEALTLDNYVEAFRGEALKDLGDPLWNSVVCMIVVGSAAIFAGAVIGHLASRVVDRNSVLANALLVFAYALPPIVLIFPFSLLRQEVGLPPTVVIIAAHVGFITPFCLRLAKDYFSTLGPHLDRMALNDRSRPLQTLLVIFLPKLKSELAMIGVFGVIISWNDILFSRYLGPGRPSKTFIDVLDIRLKNSTDLTDYGVIAAFSVLVAIGGVLIFMLLQNRIFSHTEKLVRGH